MRQAQDIVKGILVKESEQRFIRTEDGREIFKNMKIWDGYLTHWEGRQVYARALEMTDYDSGKPFVIIWPVVHQSEDPFLEIYFNERLVKYYASTFGHIAINLDGKIFNFSHKLNENEVISIEEYFYRPALGEFAPSPDTGKYEIREDGRVFYDKFGRNFMRTIHVVRVEGLDTTVLMEILLDELRQIREAPLNIKDPEKYSEFNFFTRSCVTIIRDSLNRYGFDTIKGIFPKDLFISAAFLFQKKTEYNVRVFRMPQLLVPEAPPSAEPPVMNLKNRVREKKLVYEN
ncbi:MAG: hypothetical protein V3U16_06505 [Candidatus Neomarinimicrobiota bacterium]